MTRKSRNWVCAIAAIPFSAVLLSAHAYADRPSAEGGSGSGSVHAGSAHKKAAKHDQKGYVVHHNPAASAAAEKKAESDRTSTWYPGTTLGTTNDGPKYR